MLHDRDTHRSYDSRLSELEEKLRAARGDIVWLWVVVGILVLATIFMR
jgi:hypothetical protein